MAEIFNLRITQSQKRVDAGRDVFMALPVDDAENLVEFMMFIIAYEISAGLKGDLSTVCQKSDQSPIFFNLINKIFNEEVIDPLIKFVKSAQTNKKSQILTRLKQVRKESVYGVLDNDADG
jgi:5,10-methylenetetrahydrofolate reductase